MCDFVSWKEVKVDDTTHIFYLTDDEVFSEEGKRKFSDSKDNDVLGHGAINKFFELKGKGRDCEVRDFWNLHKLPAEIAKKIQHFDAHWGKMFASGAFQTDDLKYIIKNGPKDWKEKARKQLLAQSFKVLKSFSLTVPKDYKHDTQLSTLNPKDFYYFNDNVTDENFRKATQKLIPGKTYTVKIVNVDSGSSSEECLEAYKRENAILTGAQGLSLAYQLKNEEFPKGRWLLSFDEKKALWQDSDGYHGVPDVDRSSVGGFEFRLSNFEGDWLGDSCMLLFCDGE